MSAKVKDFPFFFNAAARCHWSCIPPCLSNNNNNINYNRKKKPTKSR